MIRKSEQGAIKTLKDDGCISCGDVAVPVKVIEVHNGDALVEDHSGMRAVVAVDFIPDVKEGDILLIHAGCAIGRAAEVNR